MPIIREGPIKLSVDDNKKWSEKYFKLNSEGMLEMYSDAKDKSADAIFNLKELYDCVCFGEYCNNVPSKPELPKPYDQKLTACIPKNKEKKPSEVEWLLFNNEQDLRSWMPAIFSTFPRQDNVRQGSGRRDKPIGGARGLPPQAGGPAPTTPNTNPNRPTGPPMPQQPDRAPGNYPSQAQSNSQVIQNRQAKQNTMMMQEPIVQIPPAQMYGCGNGWAMQPGYVQPVSYVAPGTYDASYMLMAQQQLMFQQNMNMQSQMYMNAQLNANRDMRNLLIADAVVDGIILGEELLFGRNHYYNQGREYNKNETIIINNNERIENINNTTINNTSINNINIENDNTNINNNYNENNNYNYKDNDNSNQDNYLGNHDDHNVQSDYHQDYDQSGYYQEGNDQGAYDQGGYDQGGDQGGYDLGVEQGGYDGDQGQDYGGDQ